MRPPMTANRGDVDDGGGRWIEGIVALLGVAVTATGGVIVKVVKHETELNSVQKRLDAHGIKINDLSISAEGVRTDVGHIKDGVKDLNVKIDRLLRNGRKT